MSGKLRLVLAVCALLAALTPTAARAATPEFFPVPEAHRFVQTGITTDGQGNVWFSSEGTQVDGMLRSPDLARLTVSAATAGAPVGFSFFPTPLVLGETCCARIVRDLAYDARKDRVWFVRSRGVIGFASPAMVSNGSETGISVGGVPEFPDLGSLAVAPGGPVWFTESSAYNVSPYPGNRIAYAGDGLGITEFPDLWHQFGVPADSTRYDAQPTGIAIDSHGFPWFTEANPGNPGYRIAKGNPAGAGTYEEYQVKPCGSGSPCSGSFTGTGVYGIAVALDDTVWFTNVLKNSIGSFDPATQTFAEYPLTAVSGSLAGGEPRAIRLARDGTLWIVERGGISHPAANSLIQLVPGKTPTATVYPLGADNSPLSVAPDDRGNVWFLVSGSSSAIGRLAGVVGTPPPVVSEKPTSAPPGVVTLRSSGGGIAKVNDPALRNGKVEVTQICVGPPEDRCSLVYLLDSHEYVSGFPGTTPRLAGASAKRRTRLVVVGRKAVTLAGGEQAKVTISLNAKGKKILKRDGVLKLTFNASQQVTSGKKKTLKPLKTKKLTIRVTK